MAPHITEIRVHGVGGTSPATMLGRSDVVQVAGDEISGFYRVADRRGSRSVEAYSWGGLTARSATRALWTLLLPFSLINIAGWMIEPVREREIGPSPWPFGAMDRLLARLGGRISGISEWLRRAQEWLVHLLALIFSATYIQFAAYLAVDLVGFQCGSEDACLARLPLTGVLGSEFEVGRRLVIGTALPLALLLLFLYLARSSRQTYESFKPQIGEIKPTGATPLEHAEVWDRAKYQKIMARLHAVTCLGILVTTFSGTIQLLSPGGWRRALYTGGVVGGALIAIASFLLVGWVAARRDRTLSASEGDGVEEREKEVYVTGNRVSSAALAVVLAVLLVLLAATWPVQSTASTDEVITWFALAPLWLLLVAIGIGVLISTVQALRWLAEKYIHSDQFLVVIAAVVVALFPYVQVMVAVAVILVAVNVVASKANGRTAILRDLTVLTAPAIVGLVLWLASEEPAYGWFGVGLTTVAAALFWLARRPEPGFRWAGTGAIGALAAAVLLGLFSGLIIRTASWLSVDEIAINYPDFYQWAVVIVTIGLAVVVIALLLHGVRLWWSNGSEWRSRAKQRLHDAGYPDDAVEGLASSTVISRSLSETINGADVMITLAGMVMFAALVSRVVDFVFRGRSVNDWFPETDRAWALLFDVSSWLALATIVAAYLAVRSAIRSEATRRKIGIVWDVASFFPRSFHPLAPPAYAARAVPEIQARVTETVNSGGRVVLAGHSQGSVIVAAVMASLPDDVKAKTALVTYGSPIGRFYRPFFPAAFPDELVYSLAEKVGPSDEQPKQLYWINFYRSTDPIGQAALRTGELSNMSVPTLAAVALAARERTAIACDVLLEDPWETKVRPYRPIPRLRGHSGYESDPAWAAGVQSLAILLGQTAAEDDLVVLVDQADIEVGTAEKIEAHDKGLLHRAVSVFLFDSQGRLLIQQRAGTKHIFAGLWANSSCTHPRPAESSVEAGRRSLRNELGLDAELIDLATFDYRATDETTGLTEAEVDHVLIGSTDEEPEPNPKEVADHAWITIAGLRDRMRDEPQAFVPWLLPALAVLEGAGLLPSD